MLSRFAEPGAAGSDAVAFAAALGMSTTCADALWRRGFRDIEATRRFLQPRLTDLHQPDGMLDRAVAAERIVRAIRARERVVIFGDYDCDGITSTALLTDVIRALGGEAIPLLATRREGSYGFSVPALQRVLSASPSLVITCDCGSSDHERLFELRRRGIDAVVIDHHLVPPEPLPVMAFLNPHRPDCAFPYKGLASVGLALSIAAALRKALGADLDLRRWLDLVAIGTIADVAPLDGDNRALVRAGLAMLASAPRPGVVALANLGKLRLADGLTAEDVAFRIAPRLNAPGRLRDPDLALALLLERDPNRAAAIAAEVETIQLERREIQARILQEALAEIDASGYAKAPALMLARAGWHPGVVGIVAGQLAARFGKPVIVAAIESGEARGSVRGPQGVRLHDALTHCRDELVSFGGHQAAAGVHVQPERVARLRDAWCEAFRSHPQWCGGSAVASSGDSIPGVLEAVPEDPNQHPGSFLEPGCQADVQLAAGDDPLRVVEDLRQLEPCGQANPGVSVMLQGARIVQARNLKGHLKLVLAYEGATLAGFAFEKGPLAAKLSGREICVVGKLRKDNYAREPRAELRVEGVLVNS